MYPYQQANKQWQSDKMSLVKRTIEDLSIFAQAKFFFVPKQSREKMISNNVSLFAAKDNNRIWNKREN